MNSYEIRYSMMNYMYDFILQLSMVISLGVIVYLLARAVPRLPDEVETAVDRPSYFDRWLERVSLLNLDERFSALIAKFLRRLRVIVLKCDNLIHRHLTRIKQRQANGGSETKPNLFEELNDEGK